MYVRTLNLTFLSVSDQSVCSSLRCGVNAQCLLQANSPTCLCVEGFTGDGQLCMGEYVGMCGNKEYIHTLKKVTRTTYYTETFLSDSNLCSLWRLLTVFSLDLDIDECILGTHNCNRNTECQNTLGKFFCKCQAGHNSNEQTCQGLSKTSTEMCLRTNKYLALYLCILMRLLQHFSTIRP